MAPGRAVCVEQGVFTSCSCYSGRWAGVAVKLSRLVASCGLDCLDNSRVAGYQDWWESSCVEVSIVFLPAYVCFGLCIESFENLYRFFVVPREGDWSSWPSTFEKGNTAWKAVASEGVNAPKLLVNSLCPISRRHLSCGNRFLSKAGCRSFPYDYRLSVPGQSCLIE